MKKILFLALYVLCFNKALGQSVEYKDASQSNNYSVLNYSDDCEKILEIKDNNEYEFKDKEQLSDIIYKCKLFLKGQKVKKGSGKVKDVGVKVKDGVVNQGVVLKDEVVKATGEVVKTTNTLVGAGVDTGAKVKDGIVAGKDKALAVGSKVSDGVKSFFKGIFD